MAYDSIKARKAIQTANIYERLPGSEFVLDMAKILKDADGEIAGAAEKIRGAEREARRYQREADELREDYRMLREASGRPLDLVRAALEQIAKGAKGAKKIAGDALAEVERYTARNGTKPGAENEAGAEPPFYRKAEQPIIDDRIGAPPETPVQ